jgi:hypothetical protein
MRLYPAIPVFPREAAADDVLPSQHPVSKGEQAYVTFTCNVSHTASVHHAHRCVQQMTCCPASTQSAKVSNVGYTYAQKHQCFSVFVWHHWLCVCT